MAKKDTANLKAELLALKESAINIYKDIVSKEVDVVKAINDGDFDVLFEMFPKETWANFAKQAQDAHDSWFFSGLKTGMFTSGLESVISQIFVQLPVVVSNEFVKQNAAKILSDYFELDAAGMIKPEDFEANKDAFSVFNDVATGMNSKGGGGNHSMVVDHKFSDGTETHMEAKFDAEKFGEWIKYNLVEEHYLDHMVDV